MIIVLNIETKKPNIQIENRKQQTKPNKTIYAEVESIHSEVDS